MCCGMFETKTLSARGVFFFLTKRPMVSKPAILKIRFYKAWKVYVKLQFDMREFRPFATPTFASGP